MNKASGLKQWEERETNTAEIEGDGGREQRRSHKMAFVCRFRGICPLCALDHNDIVFGDRASSQLVDVGGP